MMGELWTYSRCIGSGASCAIIVGDQWHGTFGSSQSESRLYMDNDEDDDYFSSSSIHIISLSSIAALLFSTLDF